MEGLYRAAQASWEAMPYILGGLWWTAGLIIGAMLVGFILGVPLAVLHVYGRTLTRKAVAGYVWLFRGVPILVQLYLFYFGIMAYLSEIPALSFLPLSSGFLSAVIVLGLTSAAYQSQIFRGAMASLPAGQLKAARALGMSDAVAIRTIILPQALRLALPGLVNTWIVLLKDTALVSLAGLNDLIAQAKIAAGSTKEPFMFFTAALVFFVLISSLTLPLVRQIALRLERGQRRAGV